MKSNNKFPLPKKYWLLIAIIVVLGALLFLNIFRTDAQTGGKEFWDFTRDDWHIFVVFLIEEAVIVALMFAAAVAGGRIDKKNNEKKAEYYDQLKYSGIKAGDYDHVWFDFSGEERALILKSDNTYRLWFEVFDYKTETWQPINSVSCFESMSSLKYSLFYDFEFFCEENAEISKHGDEIFRE